jgi:plasmid stabilization system protein ParE
MPPLKWSQRSLRDIGRLYEFLAAKNPDVAKRAVKAIRQGLRQLARHPEMGRPVEELPEEFREWVVEFGSGAYLTLYRHDGKEVVILAIRHGREERY